MKINDDGFKLVKEFEGCSLAAYLDPVGIPTQGYGHIQGVKIGTTITQAEAESLLAADLKWAEEAVGAAVQVELNPNQFSALVSFTFNLGASAFAGSTLLKYVNKKDFQSAAGEFIKWNKAGGQVLAGLTRRREAEKALFLKGSTVTPVVPPTVPVRKNWLFICPADNPKNAVEIPEEYVSNLTFYMEMISKQLGLPYSVDKVNKKIYLGKGKIEKSFVSKLPETNPITAKTSMKQGDIHIVCSGKLKTMQGYNFEGKKLFSVPCLMEGINGGAPSNPSWTSQGSDTPPGFWQLTAVEDINPPERPFGSYFCWMTPLSGECLRVARGGIGYHFAGSNAPNPFADIQGLYPTEGCIRGINKDGREITIPLIKATLKNKHKVWMTTTWD